MRNRKPQHIIKHMFDRGYATFDSRPYTRKVGNARVIIAGPSKKSNESRKKSNGNVVITLRILIN